MQLMSSSQGPEAAQRLLRFLNQSPTPFHAVHNAIVQLEKAGFQKILEQDAWEETIEPGGKYYFTRNQAALVAFALPQKWKQGAGVSIVATHVDSPNLKVRPVSKRTKEGYLQVAVETYGGGIWHSWLDRDLSVAGRVVTTHADGFKSKLVKIDRPLLRIPTLAIHLDRNVNDTFKFNQETEFVPILGQVASQLNEPAPTPMDSGPQKASSIQNNHHSALLSLLAGELSVAPEEIHDFELSLYDTQPSVLGGLNSEFVFSPRLDNQFSTFCSVEALAQSVQAPDFNTLEGNVICLCAFNHEEIGSVSTSGADSNLLPSLINRLSPTPGTFAQSVSKSFLISADMGHAVHPNYTSKHEDNHKPRMNGGVVIKTNAKQRYATDAVTSFMVKQLVERKGGQVQEYEVRNDMACGSTVGPMLSKMGIKTCDVGFAQLSMHSIRETAGSHDVQHGIDLFRSLFENYAELERNLVVD
ncbi:aspartyl aminopeptidase [Mycena metata]|uniref:aspartyl aminopeptidase n=1 Tax=Mycena metata TaxID=1033252 RepID=A0AAD7KEA9_9AGAR|nr:aspartyl aminopeptidase [Mycena metata]